MKLMLYDRNTFCFPFSPESVLYFETFFGEGNCRSKKTELLYTVAFEELYNKSCGNLVSQLQTFIENKVMITIRKSRFHYHIL